MKGEDKKKEGLIKELVEMRRRIAELETKETERMRAEESLIKTKARFEYLLAICPAVIYCAKPEDDYAATFISENVKEQMGYEPKEFLEDPKFWVNHIHPEDAPRIIAGLPILFKQGHHIHEYRFKHEDGTYKWMHDEMRLVRDDDGKPLEIVGYWIDITERKEVEEELLRSRNGLEIRVKERTVELLRTNEILKKEISERKQTEEILRNIIEGASAEIGVAFFISLVKSLSTALQVSYVFIGKQDEAAQYVDTIAFSAKGEIIPNFRYKLEGAPCNNVLNKEICVYPKGVARLFPRDKLLAEMHIESYMGYPLIGSDEKPLGLLVIMDNKPLEMLELKKMLLKVFAVRATNELERINSYDRLKLSEANYRSIFNSTNDAIFVHDTETGKILDVNRKMCEMYGYTLEEVRNLDVEALSAGVPPYSQEDAIKWITRAVQGEPQLFEWKAKDKEGRIFWIEVNLKQTKIEGKDRILAVVRDITERKNSEEALLQGYIKLQKVLEGTVGALASAVEMRDPYTAGHQRRVTVIACAIAGEMGLSEDLIKGVHLAGIIHDIGKIAIPAEILTKPGRLSEIEYSFIKTHSQIGYDILKSVEFSWPIAQIVLQHHERLNGSGYPRGLSSGDIILEAKIISVADVVEAMATHRPYRSAMGIDKALQEVSQNKGILYDTEVADICVKLFNEKGFKIE